MKEVKEERIRGGDRGGGLPLDVGVAHSSMVEVMVQSSYHQG